MRWFTVTAAHRQAAAAGWELGSHPNNMSAVIRAFEDAGVMFLSATKVAGRELGCESSAARQRGPLP